MKIIPFPAESLTNTEWVNIDPDKILAGSPQSTYKILYTNKTEEFMAGIYECTAGKWKVSHNEEEFCTLIEGTVRLANDQGETQEFSAPQSFLIPSGFSGTWEAVGKLRKFFVIYARAE